MKSVVSFDFSALLLASLIFLGLPNVLAAAQTETVLHSFAGNREGRSPGSGLVFDGAGNLYGTTVSRGGTVFKLSPNLDGTWTQTTLYDFRNEGKPQPCGPLVFDTEGNIYGVTRTGYGYGTLFELNPDGAGGWQKAILHAFAGGDDGQTPNCGLALDGMAIFTARPPSGARTTLARLSR